MEKILEQEEEYADGCSDFCSATSAGSAVNGPGRLFDRAVVVIPAHNEAGHLPR
jgi:hypothetical protein